MRCYQTFGGAVGDSVGNGIWGGGRSSSPGGFGLAWEGRSVRLASYGQSALTQWASFSVPSTSRKA